MDLERIAARARLVLGLLGVLGLLVFGAATAVFVADLSRSSAAASGWRPPIDAGAAMVTMALGLAMVVIPLALIPLVGMIARRATDERWQYEQMMGAMESQRGILDKIREVASLSDSAKQIAYRAKDLEALRNTIREDIEKGDYEAATLLADDMERRFGYKQEADRFREQIQSSSRAAIDARVREIREQMEESLKRLDWPEAQRLAERAGRQFPLHPDARQLAERVEQARDAHKRELLKQWRDAIARDDVDRSVDLLRQLDQYLSPSEAEAYKENARDVFRKRLQQLGVQFALHVHDKNWNEALRIGKQITDEFPNTRMAAEIRERMPGLQDKASGKQPAAV